MLVNDPKTADHLQDCIDHANANLDFLGGELIVLLQFKALREIVISLDEKYKDSFAFQKHFDLTELNQFINYDCDDPAELLDACIDDIKENNRIIQLHLEAMGEVLMLEQLED